MAADITFDIVKHVGVVSEGSRGWVRELNIVSWNSAAPKYDLRDWDSEHQKMRKGITLTEKELRRLKEVIDAEVEALGPEKAEEAK